MRRALQTLFLLSLVACTKLEDRTEGPPEPSERVDPDGTFVGVAVPL